MFYLDMLHHPLSEGKFKGHFRHPQPPRDPMQDPMRDPPRDPQLRHWQAHLVYTAFHRHLYQKKLLDENRENQVIALEDVILEIPEEKKIILVIEEALFGGDILEVEAEVVVGKE